MANKKKKLISKFRSYKVLGYQLTNSISCKLLTGQIRTLAVNVDASRALLLAQNKKMQLRNLVTCMSRVAKQNCSHVRRKLSNMLDDR